MPKSLADGKIKLAILSTKPVNPLAPTTAELNAGIDASPRILSSDYTLGAVDSDKVAEKPLSQEGNSNAMGPSNYQAAVSPFRYFTAGGASEAGEDTVYQTLKTKGARVWLVERQTSKLATAAWATGDEVSVFECITDNPQKPSDAGGYVKRRVPMEVQDAWLGGTVA